MLVHARSARRWHALVGRAELEPRLYRWVGSGRPSWRLVLRQRSERVLASSVPGCARGMRRCRSAYDGRRLCRVVFLQWRLWTQGRLLDEQCTVAEARHAALHVSPAPWWEAGRDDA